MGTKYTYYVSVHNELEKYIKNSDSSCEIIQILNGEPCLKSFPAPYPPGDEELVEISAQQYNRIRRQLKQPA